MQCSNMAWNCAALKKKEKYNIFKMVCHICLGCNATWKYAFTFLIMVAMFMETREAYTAWFYDLADYTTGLGHLTNTTKW